MTAPRIKPPFWDRFRWIGIAGGIALAAALVFYYRWADQDDFARICRHSYATARTAADTLAVDLRVTEPAYPRTPREGLTCGDLQRLGRLGR